MTFHKGKKSKKVIHKHNMTEYQLIHRHIDEYKHLLTIGYNHVSAVKYLREKTKGESSTEKLRLRIQSSLNSPGVSGVSLEGIRITAPVISYIKRLEIEHIIEPYHKGQTSLHFAGKPVFPWLRPI